MNIFGDKNLGFSGMNFLSLNLCGFILRYLWKVLGLIYSCEMIKNQWNVINIQTYQNELLEEDFPQNNAR